MIVVHGRSELGEGGSGGQSFEILIDNDDPKITKDERKSINDSEVSTDPFTRFDASDASGGVELTIKGTVKGIEGMSIESAIVRGYTHKIKAPSFDVPSLGKEDYLREVTAFSSAAASISIGRGEWHSPKYGKITCDTQKNEKEIDVKGSTELKMEGESFEIKLALTEIFARFIGDDSYGIIQSVDFKFVGTSTTDGSVAKTEATYVNSDDRPLTNGVSGLDSADINMITFDDSMKMLGGWLDGMEISYQKRLVAKTEGMLYKALFTYKFYAEVSPRYFSSDISRIALCADRNGDQYLLSKIFTNNSHFGGKNPDVSVTARGPDVDGDITVTSTGDKIIFDTSGCSTASGRVIGDLVIEGSNYPFHPFEMPSGIATGDLVVAAVDCKIAYNGLGNTDYYREYEAHVCGLHTFDHAVRGFLNIASKQSVVNILTGLVFAVYTRGISCILMSHTLPFIYGMMYLEDLRRLGPAVTTATLSGYDAVFERFQLSMAATIKGVPRELRSDMAEQFLETVSEERVEAMSHEQQVSLTMTILCVSLNFLFPVRSAWMPAAADYGVPLGSNILENSEKTEGGLLTDDIKSMIKKNMAHNLYETAVDWNEVTVITLQRGRTVILKREGRHQEMYAIEDPGYMTGESLAKDGGPGTVDDLTYVTIPGEIADEWNEKKRKYIGIMNSPYYQYKIDGYYGSEAETKIEDQKTTKTDLQPIGTEFVIIDIDAESVKDKDGTTDVKIIRPNEDLLLALRK